MKDVANMSLWKSEELCADNRIYSDTKKGEISGEWMELKNTSQDNPEGKTLYVLLYVWILASNSHICVLMWGQVWEAARKLERDLEWGRRFSEEKG